MAKEDSEATEKKNEEPAYTPDKEERKVINQVLSDYITARSTQQKSYAQFNNRSVLEAIDDWSKRWNGYIPPRSSLLNRYQSRIFLNFTRNQIASYLSKVAMQRPKTKIKAVNKKTGFPDQMLSDVLHDLNEYSLNEENGDARLLETALETTVKGTAIVYEGYRREHRKVKIPISFDAESGEVESKEEKRVIYDNCYQRVVPLEDFYIPNAYESDLQRQPFVIERSVTTKYEAGGQYGHYKNWKYVKAGTYTMVSEPTTFYRNKLLTDLLFDQVELIRYFNRKENHHVVLANGVVIYDGPIPYKDGKYPYARYIFEPFEVPFFWGMGFPQKIMGEQDLQNTFINMMADKTYGSLLPFGLSSDLDDLIEDDILQPNKIRKVSDINKWKFETLPGVSNSEQGMFQTILNLTRENSGEMTGGAMGQTSKGGKITARQMLQKQQEAMQRIGFAMNFLEDGERDRTELRVHHILQFYSIPAIQHITGKDGKDVEQALLRDIRLDDVPLSDGRTGTKIIKLVGDETKNPDERAKLADELSVKEAMGDVLHQPVEALAVPIDSFYDHNFSVQIVKNSSYEQNQSLEQALRHDYAQWRIDLKGSIGFPVNVEELVRWVDESYSIDTDRFEGQPEPPPGVQPGLPGQEGAPDMAIQGGRPGTAPTAPNKPSSVSMNTNALGKLE